MARNEAVDRSGRMAREQVQARWTATNAPTRHLDPVLIITALALSAIGIIAIFSATQSRLTLAGQPPTLYAARQGLSLALALIGMVAFAAVDDRRIRSMSWVLYGGAVLLLILVLTPLGVTVNGAQRWIVVGSFQIQPSELAKLAVILVVAALLHEREEEHDLLTVAVAVALIAVPMVLIFLEPDLGTALVFTWLSVVLLLIGGVAIRWIVGLGVIGGAGMFGAFRTGIIEPYQLQRILSFLEPETPELAQTTLFHTLQSQIAIGSGQVFGKGLFEGTQTKLAYVPENHTDFIFTVIAEEFGFFGSVVVLALFAILIFRGIRIAMLARDTFGRVVAAGFVAILVIQVFVNIGMTVGIMPVTGMPLPFLSYGTNALIVMFAMVGLLENIHMRRFTA